MQFVLHYTHVLSDFLKYEPSLQVVHPSAYAEKSVLAEQVPQLFAHATHVPT